MSETGIQSSNRMGWGKMLMALALLVLLIIGYRTLPIDEWISTFQSWVQG